MQDFLDDFRQTVEAAADRLALISEEQSETPPGEGKWTPKEVIGHLIDSAANNHQRFVHAQFTDDLVFSGYEQEEWVRVQGYNKEPWQQLIQLWKHYNLHLQHLMSATPEATRVRARTRHSLDTIAWQAVGQNEPVTLEYFMRDYVAHMKNHLRQVLPSD